MSWNGGTSIVNITNCIIESNTASGNGLWGCGGGVYASANNSLTEVNIINSTITSNTADSWGGGICAWDMGSGITNIDIVNTIVWGNNAGTADDIYNNYFEGSAIALFLVLRRLKLS